MLPSTMRVLSIRERTSGLRSKTFIMSRYQLLLLEIASSNALRCDGKTESGTSLLISDMMVSMCFSGSSSR